MEVQDIQKVVREYRSALKKVRKSTDPEKWAGLKVNLGVRLRQLGEVENQPSRFDAAANECREALEVFTREEYPQQWADASTGLANALQRLGAVNDDAAALAEAGELYAQVMEARPRTRFAKEWTELCHNLGTLQAAVATQSGERADYEQAARTLRDALPGISKRKEPEWRASVLNELGNVYLEAGRRFDDDPELLRLALKFFDEAIPYAPLKLEPAKHGSLMQNIGGVCYLLGAKGDRAAATKSAKSFAAARKAFAGMGAAEAADYAREMEGYALALLES